MKYIYDQVQERSIETIEDLSGKKVILRVDINVPLGENHRVDPGEDWRIQKALQSIRYLQDKGACTIVIAHTGHGAQDSLKPMFDYMQEHIDLGFAYIDDELPSRVQALSHGSVLLLENLRAFSDEIEDRVDFLKPLIDVCDLYVNDAFSVSHRLHASIHLIPQYLPSYFGLQFIQEVRFLSKVVDHDGKKLVLILGGAKFDTKLQLLEKFLPKLSFACVGGAAANIFLRAQGFNIGQSYIDEERDVSHMLENEKVVLPLDCIDQEGDIIHVDEVRDEDMILDIGPETEDIFSAIIEDADIVLWNGPMGKYEDGYVSGSIAVARALKHTKALSIIGGGDTLASILDASLDESSFDFISTGGGATLDFLIDGNLPGIDAILKKQDA